jgi:hypothetical protein
MTEKVRKPRWDEQPLQRDGKQGTLLALSPLAWLLAKLFGFGRGAPLDPRKGPRPPAI